MPQWASAEGAGSEAASPEQMIYYEDDTSEYFDNKQETDIKIEQAGGKFSHVLFFYGKRQDDYVV